MVGTDIIQVKIIFWWTLTRVSPAALLCPLSSVMGTHVGIWEDYLNLYRIFIVIFIVIDIHCYYGDPYWDLENFCGVVMVFLPSPNISILWSLVSFLWCNSHPSCFTKLYSASPRFHPCQSSVDKKSETLWSFRRLYYTTSYYPSRQSLHCFKHANNILTFLPPLLNPVLFQYMPLSGLTIIKRHQQFLFRTMALVISSGCRKTEFCRISSSWGDYKYYWIYC